MCRISWYAFLETQYMLSVSEESNRLDCMLSNRRCHWEAPYTNWIPLSKLLQTRAFQAFLVTMSFFPLVFLAILIQRGAERETGVEFRFTSVGDQEGLGSATNFSVTTECKVKGPQNI
ncbi:MAG: hypothetical protein ACK56F_28145, partial [bacterium]